MADYMNNGCESEIERAEGLSQLEQSQRLNGRAH